MTKTTIEPYLFFGGRCEEALDFYKNAIGANVEAMIPFKENPETPPPGTLPEGWENKIMHALFRVGESVIMASDGCSESTASRSGFPLALNVATDADARRAFDGLAAGGEVTMPLAKTFWSPLFGMVTDRFGVGWMVNVAPEN